MKWSFLGLFGAILMLTSARFGIIRDVLVLFDGSLGLFGGGEASGSGDFDCGGGAVGGGGNNLFEAAGADIAGGVEAGDDCSVGRLFGDGWRA